MASRTCTQRIEEERIALLEQWRAHPDWTVKDASRELGVPTRTRRDWKKQYQSTLNERPAKRAGRRVSYIFLEKHNLPSGVAINGDDVHDVISGDLNVNENCEDTNRTSIVVIGVASAHHNRFGDLYDNGDVADGSGGCLDSNAKVGCSADNDRSGAGNEDESGSGAKQGNNEGEIDGDCKSGLCSSGRIGALSRIAACLELSSGTVGLSDTVNPPTAVFIRERWGRSQKFST
ncbi:hypothetical protein GN244_ATG01944 [Phytophthora infestans]|uniref:Uncharacterized protein n=1 Tax=Phytophthora infestans TaxID=4787 RepID=A0A833TD18_PHYIN|nr:hypothetical protein GN244_ATG01944 [Phytophthora infestans]